MRALFSSVQLWTYLLLILCLSPLAAWFGTVWDWTPGAATFVVLAVPTCSAALLGSRAMAFLVTGLAAFAGFLEVYLLSMDQPGIARFSFPLFATALLAALNYVTVTVAHYLRERVNRLEEQNTRHVRDLYRRDREQEAQSTETAFPPTDSLVPSPAQPEPAESDAVDYPMLLLTLQDVGRRVSTNLDIETLIPTIINTARASLKCEGVRIFYWNSREAALKGALPPRPRDRSHSMPHPRKGMAGWVLEHRQILTRKDVLADYALHTLFEDDPEMPEAIAPLAVGGELLGLLIVDDADTDAPGFVRLLYILSSIYAMGIKNAQLFKRIEDMARKDGLTGLLNHTSFQQELQTLISESSAKGAPLTVLMSDVDHFKKFNDAYGHQAGDHVLREVARLYKAVLPDYAVLARYGGEEFICALPHDDLARGRELAEILREQIAACTLDFEGKQLHVTASFGVSELCSHACTPEALVRTADEALYRAKEAGRNRVVCSPIGAVAPVAADS